MKISQLKRLMQNQVIRFGMQRRPQFELQNRYDNQIEDNRKSQLQTEPNKLHLQTEHNKLHFTNRT